MSDINNLASLVDGLSQAQLAQFERFEAFLSQYNRKLNLLARSAMDHLHEKHFADSILGLRLVLPFHQVDGPIFDFGSGNGFPGIVGAILAPEKSFFLIERDQRKAEFLKLLATHLSLQGVKVHAGPVSDLGAGSCHFVISRAMSPLPRFLLESRSVMAPKGQIFLFKGPQWTSEFGSIPPQMFDLWNVKLLADYNLPDPDGSKRSLIHCIRLA